MSRETLYEPNASWNIHNAACSSIRKRVRHVPVLLKGDEGGGPGEWSQMSFGNLHSVGVTRTGEVFTWGRGNYGSLGHGNDDTIMKPKSIHTIVKIK